MTYRKLKMGISLLTLAAALTTGTAFAGANVGGQLRYLYNGSFHEAAASFKQTQLKRAEEQLQQAVHQKQAELLQASGQAVLSAGTDWTILFNSLPAEKVRSYKGQIEAAKQELLGKDGQSGTIAERFATTMDASSVHVDEELEQGLDQMLESYMQDPDHGGQLQPIQQTNQIKGDD